jgi:hypothetical protein
MVSYPRSRHEKQVRPTDRDAIHAFVAVANIAEMTSGGPFLSSVGAPLIIGAAASAVVLASQCWFFVRHGRQRSKAVITQRLFPAEAARLVNQHKVAAPRVVRVAGEAAATGRCGP